MSNMDSEDQIIEEIMQKVKSYFFRLFVSFLLTFTTLLNGQEIQPNQIYQEYNRVLRLIGNQKYDEAILGLENIIGQDSSFNRAYLKIVEIYKYKKDLDGAQKYFDNIVKNSPDNPFVYHALGLIYTGRQKYQLAYESILRAIQLDLDYFAAYPDFVNVHRDRDEAINTIKAVAEIKPDIAAPHYGLAYIYNLKNQSQNQLEAAKKAVELNASLLEACFFVADGYYLAGDYEQALKECDLGLKLSEVKNDLENQIEFIKLKALIVNKLGDAKSAINYLQYALQMSQEIGDKVKEGDCLNDLARIHWYISQYHEAILYANQALELEKLLGKKSGQASNLIYIGIGYAELGDYSKALELYQSARDLYAEIGDKGAEGICLGNLAGLYVRLGNEHKALTLYEQSIKVLSKLSSGWDKVRANCIGQSGAAYELLSDFPKALEQYQHALQILRPIKTAGHQVTEFLRKIGSVHLQLEDYSQAKVYYEQAHKINVNIMVEANHAYNLLNSGNLSLAIGELSNAEKQFKGALEIGNKIKEIELIWNAQAGLANAYLKQGKYNKALDNFKNAVETVENVRGKLKLAEEKAGFFKDKIAIYADLINLLAELHYQYPNNGYDVEAFRYAERAKARTLLDIVYQGRLFHNITEIPSEFKQKFLINEKELENKHLDLSQELANQEDLRDQKLIFSLNNEIEALQRENAQLLKEIKEKYPSYYNLTNPTLLTIDDIQSEILSNNQVLIEYFLSDKHIYVWAFTKEKLHFSTIDLTRKELENRLANISPIFQREKVAAAVQIDHRWANIRSDLLYELYQILVKKPLADLLKPGMVLNIIPDDILYYFPFEILVTNFSQDKVEYLIEKHPISYTSSASLLNPKLHRTKKTEKDLLAFGNPDFGSKQNKGILEWLSSLKTVKSILRGDSFAPLPYAELEVKSIAENFTDAAIFIGNDATETRLKEMAGNYKFIHLATHNLADDTQPMYSKIILAQTGEESEDGFLQTYEVYNLKLNADLVVLSGCNTGLGKLSRGEGLIGMTRAFLYAGASNLVVSLWPVNDESTAELMRYFYENLKKGVGKKSALQNAKVKLIHSNDWKRNPFYWGAFVLRGE